MTHPVYHFSDLLTVAGWSLGEVSYLNGRSIVWQVNCHRGEHLLVARALTQRRAWRAAWELAAQLEE